jgi:hypothetical protein
MTSTPFIATEVIGLDKIQARLKKLPPEASDAGIDEANKYLVTVLREYPTYKYVSRKAAYGKTWESDKQRIAVMIKLRENGDWVNGVYTPHPHRTQEFRRGWQILGRGRNSLIANEVPYGKWLMDNEDQARQPGMVGWKKIKSVIDERMKRIVEKFEVGVNKAIKKLGLA